MIRRINENDFDSGILKNSDTNLISFIGIWDPNSSLVTPILRDIDGEKVVNVLEINIDQNSQIINDLDILYLPTVILYKEGKEIDRIEKSINKDNVLNMIYRNM